MEKQNTKVVLGIGNPGKKYRETRHNLGFKVVESVAETLEINDWETRFQALIAQTDLDDIRVLLVKPLTYVNVSGESAKALLDWHELTPNSLLVVMDDLDLTPGKIRLRLKGSSGGHRGMQSIIEKLDTYNIPRLRIGIGNSPCNDTISHVLSPFAQEEIEIILESIQTAKDMVIDWIKKSGN